jgi:transposase
MLVNAVLWIARTGSPWCDLHDVFGDWNSVFRCWSHEGVWWRLSEAMSDDSDFEYLVVDKHHHPRPSACFGRKKGTEDQALGLS